MTLPQHVPVLLDEVIEWLSPRSGDVIVDGTVGGGGHTRALAELVGKEGLVIGMDRDEQALSGAENLLRGRPVKIVQSNYADLPELLQQLEIESVNGILLELGLSSDQLADDQRGFSFSAEGPLDLRYDPQQGSPAWKLLERLSQQQLADLIYEYGEERYSRRIARRIVHRRQEQAIRTATELASLVRACVPKSKHSIDPATRTFQALRIAVNDELKWLDSALQRFPDCLAVDGKLAVISFHSLEDRRVKHAFRSDSRLHVLTKKPVRATEIEIDDNPRSRSAKLRVAARVAS
ncbi:MAG: 16S rRNA (cytosine(1402)-N(4))-methyltransferase RsmH [Planctomycetales bacterium]